MNNPDLKDHLATNGFLWGPEHHPYGVSGLMSYGPAGKSVKSKLELEFLDTFSKEGFDEIETPVMLPTEAWEASGHLGTFKDEMFHTKTPGGRSLTARPEIATTIYPLFKRLSNYYHGEMPFRIYQKGTVLPNDRRTEWQLRTRQYTAHEGHIFSKPEATDVGETVTYLASLASKLMQRAGLVEDTLSFREKLGDDVPFYASSAYGLYTPQADGKELELLGIQYRSNRDFERHSKQTGINLKVDGSFPEVFEISFSSDRPFLALLERSLQHIDGRPVLQLPDHLAPASAAVITLSKSEGMVSRSEDLNKNLRSAGVDTRMLGNGAVGKRYRQADALGIPYVLTVDHQSEEDGSFTVRQRDTRQQVRCSVEDLGRTIEATSNHNSDRSEIVRKLFTIGTMEDV